MEGSIVEEVAWPFPQASRGTNMGRWSHVGLMLGQRRRLWANIKKTWAEPILFVGTTTLISLATNII